MPVVGGGVVGSSSMGAVELAGAGSAVGVETRLICCAPSSGPIELVLAVRWNIPDSPAFDGRFFMIDEPDHWR